MYTKLKAILSGLIVSCFVMFYCCLLEACFIFSIYLFIYSFILHPNHYPTSQFLHHTVPPSIPRPLLRDSYGRTHYLEKASKQNCNDSDP